MLGAAIACKWADKNSRPTSGLVLPGQPGFGDPSFQAANFHDPPPLTGFLTGSLATDTFGQLQAAAMAPRAVAPPPGSQLESGEELTTLWIGNAVQTTTDAELQVTFSAYGSLVACFLLKKPSPHGFLSGFVRYATAAEAQVALSVAESGTIAIQGSVLTARWASRNTGATKGIVPEGTVGGEDSLLARAAAHGLF